MRLAVLTAYSRDYAAMAALCLPSQKSLAFRSRADWIEMPFDPTTTTKWQLMRLHLVTYSALVWLDADTFVPEDWDLPDFVGEQRFLFPIRRWPQFEYQSFAVYLRNCPETFYLLDCVSSLAQTVAEAVGAAPEYAQKAGRLPKGLVHFDGVPPWQRCLKLRAAVSTAAAELRNFGVVVRCKTDHPEPSDHPAKDAAQGPKPTPV